MSYLCTIVALRGGLKQIETIMKKAILVVLTFIIMQVVIPIVGTYILGAFGMNTGSEGSVAEEIMNPWALGIMLLAVYGLTLAALYGWKLLLPDAGLQRRGPCVGIAIAILLLALVPLSLVEELLNLSDTIGGRMDGLMRNPVGIFCLAIAGPVTEELVFRRAMLGSLLEAKIDTRIAVAVSAAVFALIHFNPAQMPAAFVIGCLFGWMYVRTGSIVASAACHVVNNSLAVVAAVALPSETLSSMLGGTGPAAAVAVACTALAAILVRIYNKKTAAVPAAIPEDSHED